MRTEKKTLDSICDKIGVMQKTSKKFENWDNVNNYQNNYYITTYGQLNMHLSLFPIILAPSIK